MGSPNKLIYDETNRSRSPVLTSGRAWYSPLEICVSRETRVAKGRKEKGSTTHEATGGGAALTGSTNSSKQHSANSHVNVCIVHDNDCIVATWSGQVQREMEGRWKGDGMEMKGR
jgi:hypothetical protein